jgi:hypothetical protein
MTTDRTTLKKKSVQSYSDFLESFADKLNILPHHSFIVRQHSYFSKELKLPVKTQETAVLYDFSVYCSIMQVDVQDFHGNNAYAAFRLWLIHKIMTQHINCVVISDCFKHNTVIVQLFQRKSCSFLSGKLKDLTKNYRFSHGAALQYKKRKYIINLCYHIGDSV